MSDEPKVIYDPQYFPACRFDSFPDEHQQCLRERHLKREGQVVVVLRCPCPCGHPEVDDGGA